MGGRHAVVVGSQCAGLPGQSLSFLPGRAEALFAVLTDPARGGCDPDSSELVVDPDLAELALAVKQGVRGAAAAGATLVLVFVGHAETLADGSGGTDLYLMPMDGVVPPDSDTGYLLGQRLREVLAGPDAVGLDGLLLVVDACHAGVGAMNVAQRAAAMVASSGVRLEMLTATFDRAARDGCFSGTLTELLSHGLAEVSNDYLDAASVLDRIAGACTAQEEPLRFSLARGRRIAGDPGLWLARNPEAAARWALSGTAAGGHAVALTRAYQVTDAIEHVQAAMLTGRVTVVTGAAGSGKSALVAALARPELAPDLVPAGGFLNAVAFTALAPAAAEIAQELAAQLAHTDGFVGATRRYQAGFESEELDRQPALQRMVVGPLRELALAPGRRVRVAVDGIDQLHPQVRRDVLEAVSDLVDDGSPVGIRVLLTSRPGLAELEWLSAGCPIELGKPAPEEATAYAQQAGVPGGLLTVVVDHAQSWLDLQLLAQVAAVAGEPAVESEVEPSVEASGLDGLYAARLAESMARAGLGSSAVLAVLGASGAGPVVPVTVAAGAATHLGVPLSVPALRDVLAGLGGIVARADPGTSAEHVGLFHETLARYLEENPGSLTVAAGHQAILDSLELVDDPAANAYRRTRTADHLWAVGRHEEALRAVVSELGPKAADNVHVLQPWVERGRVTLGPDDRVFLAFRGALASWTGRSGDVAGAVALFAELLEDRVRVLGADHPATLATRNNLAFWTGEAGDVAGAVALFAELLEDRVRVLGADHSHTLTTRNNLASLTGEAGDVAGAVALFAELLEDRVRVLGADHPDTLTTRNNLASLTGRAGDVAGAVSVFAQLLEDQVRVLGAHHPHTLSTRNNLASFTGEAGDVAGAVSLFAELLEDRVRVLGPDHPDTLTTRNNLASWTGEAGDVAGAVSLFAELLEDQVRVLGPDHPATLATRSNLAFWTGEAGDVAGAVSVFAQLLEDEMRVLGPDHPDTLTTRGNLASYTGEAGDVAGAVALFAELLEDRVRVLGADHPDTLSTRGNLASLTGEAGDAAGAVALFAQLLEDRVRVLGRDHPATLATRSNLAAWTGEAGDVAGVVALFAELLEDRVRVLGRDHPDTLATRSNLAAWTGEAGDVAGAVVLFAELLEDRVRVLGRDHPDTLATGGNLAALTGEAGDVAGAVALFAQLLEDRVRVLGADHPDTLTTRSHLAFFLENARKH